MASRKVKTPDKSAVRDALLVELRRLHATMVGAVMQTQEGVTHEDARSEGSKDMRSTEQSYIARGQAMRAEDLAEQLQRFETTPLRTYAPSDPISVGALVHVLIDDETRWFFVAAQGGGAVLQVGGAEITVVTPVSPVGALLCGRASGESFERVVRGKESEWVIELVC